MNTAERFRKARADASMELAADYLELIEDLISECGEARATDLAARMGVSHVTISKALQRLARDGFVTYRPYRSIFLTDAGRQIAKSAREKHVSMLSFLVAIGVPPDIAEQDAEGMEHHISPETLHSINEFLRGLAQLGLRTDATNGETLKLPQN
ncbi:MAG TPA: manganese-binding transcriptional regulator MntR [Fimbriimonadaceae bacterium]|nr:manganese-binding transcriptional regulator MntR [Fimbriimonadaceae bacterium]